MIESLDPAFADKAAILPSRLRALLNAHPRKSKDPWPSGKLSGVYLLSEGGKPIYVGRSRNIRQRYQAHKANSHFSASFAFLIAREETGKVANYKASQGRGELVKEPEFAIAFKRARERISKMEFRYVIEEDAITQCLLEVYCALALGTDRYNKFDTH